MRRRLLAATAAALIALGVASLTVEQTSTSGRGVCTAPGTITHSQSTQH